MRVYMCDKCKKILREADEKVFLVSSNKWDIDTSKELYGRVELCRECSRKVARFIRGEEE